MAIVTRYQSERFSFKYVRYVRATFEKDIYAWCLANKETGYDEQQGTCNAVDLPDDIREAADKMRGQAFGNVKWPS